MEKQVHVSSYVKQDGTEVREHYRTIDGADNSLVSANMNDKYKIDDNFGEKFPEI